MLKSNEALSIFSTLKDIGDKHFATQFQLQPAWARESSDGIGTVIGITDNTRNTPVNLLVVRDDLHHRYLYDIQPGQYSPIGHTIDPQVIIGCESYLSALALACRTDYWSTLVICCFEPENIWPCLENFHQRWSGIACEAAPDTRDRTLCDGTMYPPGDLTWLDLHVWESSQWAA